MNHEGTVAMVLVLVGGEAMGHIGFYLGGDEAVSNSSYSAMPIVHHWTFGEKNKRPVRRIKAIFWLFGSIRYRPLEKLLSRI